MFVLSQLLLLPAVRCCDAVRGCIRFSSPSACDRTSRACISTSSNKRVAGGCLKRMALASCGSYQIISDHFQFANLVDGVAVVCPGWRHLEMLYIMGQVFARRRELLGERKASTMSWSMSFEFLISAQCRYRCMAGDCGKMTYADPKWLLRATLSESCMGGARQQPAVPRRTYLCSSTCTSGHTLVSRKIDGNGVCELLVPSLDQSQTPSHRCLSPPLHANRCNAARWQS